MLSKKTQRMNGEKNFSSEKFSSNNIGMRRMTTTEEVDPLYEMILEDMMEEEIPPIPPPRRRRQRRQQPTPVLESQPPFGEIPRAPRRRVTALFAPVEFDGVEQETGRRKILWYIPGQDIAGNRDHTREMMQLLHQNVNTSFFLRHTTSNVLRH